MKPGEIHVLCGDCGNEFDIDPMCAWVCACYDRPDLKFTENDKTLRFMTGVLNTPNR